MSTTSKLFLPQAQFWLFTSLIFGLKWSNSYLYRTWHLKKGLIISPCWLKYYDVEEFTKRAFQILGLFFIKKMTFREYSMNTITKAKIMAYFDARNSKNRRYFFPYKISSGIHRFILVSSAIKRYRQV